MFDFKSIDIKSLIGEALDIERARKTVVSVVQVLLDKPLLLSSGVRTFGLQLLFGEFTLDRGLLSFAGYFRYGGHRSGGHGGRPDFGDWCDRGNYPSSRYPGARYRRAWQSGHPECEGCGSSASERCAYLAPAGQPLDEEIKGKLADRIGSWIIDHDREKRLSFSLAYPFVRRPLAQDAIQLTAAQNAGIGVLVFVPGADLPVMTLNQIKMVLQIAAAYGEPLDKDRIKEIIPTIAGALVCRGIARKVAGFVPALGWLVKGGMGYLGTLAIGEAALTYFEQGGSIAGVAGMLSQAGNAASDAAMEIRNQRAYQVVSDAAGRLHAEPHRRRSALRVMSRKVRSRARWIIASAIAVRRISALGRSLILSTMNFLRNRRMFCGD